jgi:hypothetical protein
VRAQKSLGESQRGKQLRQASGSWSNAWLQWALLIQTTRILWLELMTAHGTKPCRYAAMEVDLRPKLSGLDLNPFPQHTYASDSAVALHCLVNVSRKAVIGRPRYLVQSKIL